ncbi:MAG: hypothetical protein HC906_16450 [Bacteroidales bacterium]|nr:hypothetical protein [Bacteroidales bacterium]
MCQPKYAEKWVEYTNTPTGLIEDNGNNPDKNPYIEINNYFDSVYGGNVNIFEDTRYIFKEGQKVTTNTLYEILIELLTQKNRLMKRLKY